MIYSFSEPDVYLPFDETTTLYEFVPGASEPIETIGIIGSFVGVVRGDDPTNYINVIEPTSHPSGMCEKKENYGATPSVVILKVHFTIRIVAKMHRTIRETELISGDHI